MSYLKECFCFLSLGLCRGCVCGKIQSGVNYTRYWIYARVPMWVLPEMKVAEVKTTLGGGVINWLLFQ